MNIRISTKKLLLIFAFLLTAITYGQMSSAQWVTTHVFSGNGAALTKPIHFFGSKWRLSYQLEKIGKLTVSAVPLDKSPAFALTKRAAQRINFSSGSFNYLNDCYLSIADNEEIGWKIIIEEYLDWTGEWEYRKAMKESAQAEPCGSWEGSEAATLSFNVDEIPCRLEFNAEEKGMLKIKIRDAEGKLIFSNLYLQAGKVGESWIYNPGTYVMTIETNVNWTINADTLK